MDINLIKKELAFLGIRFKDNSCSYFFNGKETNVSQEQLIQTVRNNIRQNDKFLESLFDEMIESCSQEEKTGANNDTTQRLFINAIKNLYDLTSNSKFLSQYSKVFKNILRNDAGKFNEEFMNKIIEYYLGINWLRYCIINDIYKIYLLKYLQPQEKIANNTGGYIGDTAVPDRERFWSFEEDNAENEDKKRSPSYWFAVHRHDLSETYNKANEFEVGFYFPALDHANQPFQKQEDSPYPHSKVNTVDVRDRADSERKYPMEVKFPFEQEPKGSPQKFNISDYKERMKAK